MSKFEKTFAGGNPLKADELNQMAAAINDNDYQIDSLRKETGTKLTELEKLVTIPVNPTNWLNREKVENGLVAENGNLYNSDSYKRTDYIPVKEGDTLLLYDGQETREMRFVAVYDNNKTVITEKGNNSGTRSFYVQSGVSYVRITFSNAAYTDTLQLSLDGQIHDYSDYFVPTRNSFYPQIQQNTDDIKILKKSFEGKAEKKEVEDLRKEIHDISGIVTKEYLEPKNWLDFSDKDFIEGYYISNDKLYANASYNTTGFIPVKAGETYKYGNVAGSVSLREVRFGCFYDGEKNFISTFQNQNPIQIPEGVAFVRFSASSANLKEGQSMMFFFGEEPAQYSDYFSPLERYKLAEGTVGSSQIADGAITKDKLGEDVVFNSSLSGFNVSKASMGAETIATPIIHVGRHITVSAVIEGNITADGVEIGIGRGETDFNDGSSYGRYVAIKQNDVIVKLGNGTIKQTLQHGLTLGSKTFVTISKNSVENDKAQLKIITDLGEIYETDIFWMLAVGSAFVTNKTGGAISAKLSFMTRDLTKKVWLFGDSYLSYDSDARWVTKMLKSGYEGFLLNAVGGQNVDGGLTDFKNLIETGACPSIVVWMYGMNSAADSNGVVNTSWKAKTEEFLAICILNRITPILSTIPSVPNQSHIKLNEWVRTSGHRYIECAKVVELDETSGTWKEGLLETGSSRVHPTVAGANVIFGQVLVDAPELTVLD